LIVNGSEFEFPAPVWTYTITVPALAVWEAVMFAVSCVVDPYPVLDAAIAVIPQYTTEAAVNPVPVSVMETAFPCMTLLGFKDESFGAAPPGFIEL
jgi:hypothetical protein